ncbi:hypothetical protein OUZ56_013485 [Daphnia magna]|uniref:Uncharacterized protein n=1 Tax=Daphnia magna TaxID=35525 RepID=A0ABQ9Z616_9CRUS|nr:hypothetical protein OUZ56_013485 [Daphnia magna]
MYRAGANAHYGYYCQIKKKIRLKNGGESALDRLKNDAAQHKMEEDQEEPTEIVHLKQSLSEPTF